MKIVATNLKNRSLRTPCAHAQPFCQRPHRTTSCRARAMLQECLQPHVAADAQMGRRAHGIVAHPAWRTPPPDVLDATYFLRIIRVNKKVQKRPLYVEMIILCRYFNHQNSKAVPQILLRRPWWLVLHLDVTSYDIPTTMTAHNPVCAAPLCEAPFV